GKWMNASKTRGLRILFRIRLNQIGWVFTFMGCKGSSVRITPSRPNNSKESSHLAVTGFFYVCAFFGDLHFCPTEDF
ncbi:MAG: hypothetical protein RSG92_29315, partial [Pseudomonas sp.]